MSLGFIGGTGRLGQEIAKGLKTASGFDSFKAFVRPDSKSGEKADLLRGLGYEIVPVEFDDEDALASAFSGVKTLVSTMSPKAIWKVESVALKAAKKAGVSLFVPSQFGVDNERFKSDFPFLKGKDKIVELAEAEGLSVLRVCPGYFSDIMFEVTGDPWNGEVKMIGDASSSAKMSFTRRRDVGYVLAKALSDPTYNQGGTLTMQGDCMTWSDALDLLFKQMEPNTKFEIEKMTVEEATEKMEALLEKGKTHPWEGFKALNLHFLIEPAKGNDGADMSATATSLGHNMESLEETFQDIYKMLDPED